MNDISNFEINRDPAGPHWFISLSDNGGKRPQGLKELLLLMRVSPFPLYSTYQLGN